jgi:DNA-binding Lrp family transcriptional regulator
MNKPLALDPVDRSILHHLQQNARLSVAELAQKVGLSASPVWRRVRALEEAGVITGYQALVDAAAVGLSVSVFVHVSLEKQIEPALEAFEAAVRRRPEVMECYLMTGDADYLLRVVVPDLAAYERFLMDHLTRIRGIASIKSSFALRPVKHGSELPLAEEAAPPRRKTGHAQRTL